MKRQFKQSTISPRSAKRTTTIDLKSLDTQQ